MLQLPQCYDSHVHFLGTGQVAIGLKLNHLKSINDLSSIQLKPEYFRGEWLVGFGWDQNQWGMQEFPTAQQLDQIFPNIPVFFTRGDGHVGWLNSAGLKATGFFQKTESEIPTPAGGKILRDVNGFPTGIFFDAAKIAIELQLPAYSDSQIRQQLQTAVRIFNKSGFTHIRDMTCSSQQWQQMIQMDNAGDLTVYVESYFVCEGISDWQRCLQEFGYARKNPSQRLRANGIKLFVDGALGSEGAFLSQPYASGKIGSLCWPESEIKQIIQQAWAKDIEIAVHTIGDAAVDFVAESALQLKDQFPNGQITFEHAEIIQPRTIPTIRLLGAPVHMQPSHFLSDFSWLQSKVGSLYSHCFPWQALQSHNVPVFFGSDSPIESPSLARTEEALTSSAQKGIPKWNGEWWRGHLHPDSTWGPNCITTLNQNEISVTFDSKILF